MSSTFSDQPPQVGSTPGPQPDVPPGPPQRPRGGSMLTDIYEVAGRPALLAGLMLVLLGRGCDTIAKRSVQRAQMKSRLAQNAVEDQQQSERDPIETKIQELEEKIQEEQDKDADERDQERIQSLQEDRSDRMEDLQELREEQAKQREELERTEWRRLSQKARDAEAKYQTSAYWREILFVLGTLVLAFGLLAVSWTGTGPERWICLIMLAILTLSIYVFGFAWAWVAFP